VSVAVTQGIKISVVVKYVEVESEPRRDRFLFAYTVTIENEGDEPAQLRSRHWIIQDAFNHVEEVIGDGVVGQTPYLRPGESFSYTSSCPLRTDWGTMRGTYGMVRPNGQVFEANIAPFALLRPCALN